MIYCFPIAFALNQFSMTGFMILLGIFGRSSMAAEFGIVHGATTALFYAFSANARNLILNIDSKITVESLVNSRLLLIIPLSIAAFFLGVSVPDVSWTIAILLIIRRCTEWLSELHLSYLESRRAAGFANLFSAVQSVLLVFAFFWMFVFKEFFWIGLLLWASAPLLLHLKFIYKTVGRTRNIFGSYSLFLPHLGSTAIIGIGVYIFRLLVLFLAGKNLAGDLYAAFAIGGFVSSAFVHALGPTLVFNYEGQNRSVFPTWFKIVMVGFVLFGIAIWLSSQFGSISFFSTSGSHIFWTTTGLSMVGGAIMILGQSLRIRILQSFGKEDVFGPDLMINILILAFVPFSFYLIGREILPFLFLINACTTLVFYVFANNRIDLGAIPDTQAKTPLIYLYIIAFILIFPLFFQLDGSIFHDPGYIFDTKGQLTSLPIPISVFACFGGLLMISNYKRAVDALYMVFFVFLLMTASTLITTQSQYADQKFKFILMIQFILPMFALILGKMFEPVAFKTGRQSIFEKAASIVIVTVIPVQLFSTWLAGIPILSPEMFFFSIYQHLQYVPTILICCYILIVYSFFDKNEYFSKIICLAPLIAIYTVLSLLKTTAAALISGLILFCSINFVKSTDFKSIAFCITVFAFLGLSFWYFRYDENISQRYQFEKPGMMERSKIPESNLEATVKNWRFHISGVLASSKSLMFGNPQRPDREKHQSAHNYYLDLAYNFGIASLIPVIILILKTFKKIYEFRTQILKDKSLIGLIFVVLFLLLVDNSLKVGMRQPYPGFITFFLWGLLLSRLQLIGTELSNKTT